MINLRDYQDEALSAESEHRASVQSETRLAIVMATGLGKTIVIAERAVRFLEAEVAAHGLARRPVLILVHTDELAQQAEAKVRLQAGARWSVGVVKAERDEVRADIVIGSVATLADPHRRARLTDVGLVIVDECHHASAPTYQRLLAYYGCFPTVNTFGWEPLVPALGFTATLERGDGASLGHVWQDVAFTRNISWAVRRGWLVQPVGYRIEITPETGGGHFAEAAALQDMQMIDALAPAKIVEAWQARAADRQTVAFMPLVRSARALRDAFEAVGVSAALVWGEMPERLRRTTLARYEAGLIQVVVNAMVLTEGWDSPGTSCVIIGRPTKSRPLFIQMAGRGLRPDPLRPVEDQDCLLLVVADSTTDMCTVADLSDKPIDRKVQGALTVMEDEWDIGAGIEDVEHVYEGHVSAAQFDPLVSRSSKVWKRTKGGAPFLPISKDGYLFIVDGTVYRQRTEGRQSKVTGEGNYPDLELAMVAAERLAEDLGGDLGRMLADKTRPWRAKKPTEEVLDLARAVGIPQAQVDKIMEARASGKAGKVSDLIATVVASRALDKFVQRIKEKAGA